MSLVTEISPFNVINKVSAFHAITDVRAPSGFGELAKEGCIAWENFDSDQGV